MYFLLVPRNCPNAEVRALKDVMVTALVSRNEKQALVVLPKRSIRLEERLAKARVAFRGQALLPSNFVPATDYAFLFARIREGSTTTLKNNTMTRMWNN